MRFRRCPLSRSEGDEFEQWIIDRFAASNGFTALILLLSIDKGRIDMISCSYLHVIGNEVAWRDMKTMLDASLRKWDAVAIFPESPPAGGPLLDLIAKARLQERIDEITANRMVLNSSGLFNRNGRAFRIDPVQGDDR